MTDTTQNDPFADELEKALIGARPEETPEEPEETPEEPEETPEETTEVAASEEDWVNQLDPKAAEYLNRQQEQLRQYDQNYRAAVGRVQPLQRELDELRKQVASLQGQGAVQAPPKSEPETPRSQAWEEWKQLNPEDAQAIEDRLARVEAAPQKLREDIRDQEIGKLREEFGRTLEPLMESYRASQRELALTRLDTDAPDWREMEDRGIARRFAEQAPQEVRALYSSPNVDANIAFYRILQQQLGQSQAPAGKTAQRRREALTRTAPTQGVAPRSPGKGGASGALEEAFAAVIGRGEAIPDLE